LYKRNHSYHVNLRSLAIAEELDIPCFSVVNQVRSMLARQTGCGVYLNAGREVAVASTKAFTCQVTVLTLIAVWFAQQQQKGGKTEVSRFFTHNVIQAMLIFLLSLKEDATSSKHFIVFQQTLE